MTATATDDAWMETCLIAISPIGGASDMKFHALTDSVKADMGEKDIEGLPLCSGGRITKFTPETYGTITFEGYCLQAGTNATVTGTGFFDLMHVKDTTVPIRITNSRTRTKYRVLILWTNDTTVTGAQQTTAANKSALRIGMAGGYFTKVDYDFTDGILKVTATYKCAAFDKDGSSQKMIESCAGATGADLLPAIAAYTTTNAFG